VLLCNSLGVFFDGLRFKVLELGFKVFMVTFKVIVVQLFKGNFFLRYWV